MNTRRWRRRIGGWGLVSVGGGAALSTLVVWGLDAPLLTAFFGVLAIGGAFILRGRESVYYYLLPVVSLLALLKAVSYYLHYGTTTLTLLFALVGVVTLAKGVQGYRVLR